MSSAAIAAASFVVLTVRVPTSARWRGLIDRAGALHANSE